MLSSVASRVARVAVLALIGAACFAATNPAPHYLPQAENPDLDGGLLLPGSQVLLVWGSDATILRSDDGITWTHALTTGGADLTRVSANESGSVVVAVGAGGTVLRSTDAGRTWNPAHGIETAEDLRAVVNQGKTWIAAGTHGVILRSTDDGKRWSVVDSHLEVAFLTLFADTGSKTILIGGDGLVGSSKDAGLTWQITALAMPDPVTPITTFHRVGKLLLATSALGRFITSEDDGASWDLMQASTQASFTDCAFDARSNAIVMTGSNGDVLRSMDGGRSWQGSEVTIGVRRNFLSAIRFDERSGSLVIAGQGGTFARSTDGGASWAQASDAIDGDVRGLINDTARGRLFAFGAGSLIASSKDSGAHWTTAHVARR